MYLRAISKRRKTADPRPVRRIKRGDNAVAPPNLRNRVQPGLFSEHALDIVE